MKPEAIIGRLARLRALLEKFPVDPKCFQPWKAIYQEIWELEDRLKWCIPIDRKPSFHCLRQQIEFDFTKTLHHCPEAARGCEQVKWKWAA